MTHDPSLSRIVHLHSCIGKGSFSDVYKIVVSQATGKNKKSKKYEYALKILNLVNHGLRSPIELAIMTQISHPHLTHAIRVEIEDDKTALKILLPLAIGDLSDVIRSTGARPEMWLLQKWMMQLMSAVAVLHSHGILHGDIKARNVLVFNKARARNLDEAYVQLNDFNLSSLILRPHCLISRPIAYTSTHRAPEIWQGKCWGFAADIWALGCTFYEMVYGSSLFPSQRGVAEEKSVYRQMHAEWEAFLSSRVQSVAEIPPMKPPMLHLDWDKTEMSAFNTLLLTMLTPEMSRRPTIFQLIRDPYFGDVYDHSILPTATQQQHPNLVCEESLTAVSPLYSEEILPHLPRGLEDDGLVDLSSYLYRLVCQIESGEVEVSGQQTTPIININSSGNRSRTSPEGLRGPCPSGLPATRGGPSCRVDLCMRIASKMTNLGLPARSESSREFIVAETNLIQKLQYRLLPGIAGPLSSNIRDWG